MRVQLANVLEGIVCQQLLPLREGKGRVGAYEVMVTNSAIKNLIREGKTFQLSSQIQTGKKQGMQTMDDCLFRLFSDKRISGESAVAFAHDPKMMAQKCLL